MVVGTELENAANVFVQQSSVTVPLNTFADTVTVLGAGIDIGAVGALVGGAPSGPAAIGWNLVGGQVTPELLDEKLHMTGLCGRIERRFLEDDGTLIDRAESAPDSPPDNAHYGFATNDIPVVSSPLIGKVEVIAQTDTGPGGAWKTVNSTTVSIEEYHLDRPAEPTAAAHRGGRRAVAAGLRRTHGEDMACGPEGLWHVPDVRRRHRT